VDSRLEDALNQMLREYEEYMASIAREVAQQLSGESKLTIFRSYMYHIYEYVASAQAFQDAQRFFSYQAMNRGISSAEVDAYLHEDGYIQEVVLRASLRSIAVLARELQVINEFRINWHLLHRRFVEAAEEAYENYMAAEECVARIYS